jgi:hypothetical protein
MGGTQQISHCLGLLGLVAILVVLPASGRAAPALLLGDAGDAAASEQARDRVQLLTGTAVAADRTYGPDEVFATVKYQPLVTGDLESYGCTGPALDQPGFDARLAQAMTQVDELDLELAEGSLMSLEADLACSVAVVGTRQLHDIFFFAGLMAAYNGDKDAATTRFQNATSVKNDVPLPTDFPPEVQQLYLLGREASMNATPSTLTVLPPVDARKAWLDGRSIDPTGEAVPVRPGAHLLHIETEAGVLRAVGLRVAGDGIWADQRAATSAILAGAAEGPAGAAADAMLTHAAAAWGAATVFVVDQRTVFVWGDDPGLERARVPLKPTGDRVGFRVGIGVLAREADHRPAPFVYAAPGLEFEIATLKGLEIAGGFAIGLTEVVPDTVSLLPSGELGVQWAWAGTRIRPFVGARAALVAASSTDIRAGALAQLGLRLHPIRQGGLRVGVSLGFGWVGNIQAQARITVGFGAGGPRVGANP